MGFVALIISFLLEQVRPLPRDNPVYNVMRWVAHSVRQATDAGTTGFGAFGWLLIVGGGIALGAGLHWILGKVHPILLFCFHVLVLYCTVGFRQFSSSFSRIQLALAADDLSEARRALEDWIAPPEDNPMYARLSKEELCRLSISHAIVHSHRHVFAPLLWYILLPGPVGPILYRIAEYLSRVWADPTEPYTEFSRRAYALLDWIPLRVSMAGFAIVGNFEDAVYCWRGASQNPDENSQRGLLLAAGGGALGVHLSDPKPESRTEPNPDTSGDWQAPAPDPNSLRSAVGLVWRAVLLWLLLFAMLTMATWLGR